MDNLRELANCHLGEKSPYDDDSVTLDKAFGTELEGIMRGSSFSAHKV